MNNSKESTEVLHLNITDYAQITGDSLPTDIKIKDDDKNKPGMLSREKLPDIQQKSEQEFETVDTSSETVSIASDFKSKEPSAHSVNETALPESSAAPAVVVAYIENIVSLPQPDKDEVCHTSIIEIKESNTIEDGEHHKDIQQTNQINSVNDIKTVKEIASERDLKILKEENSGKDLITRRDKHSGLDLNTSIDSKNSQDSKTCKDSKLSKDGEIKFVLDKKTAKEIKSSKNIKEDTIFKVNTDPKEVKLIEEQLTKEKKDTKNDLVIKNDLLITSTTLVSITHEIEDEVKPTENFLLSEETDAERIPLGPEELEDSSASESKFSKLFKCLFFRKRKPKVLHNCGQYH